MKKSMADQAYLSIKQDIITLELGPGLQIAQSQLVARYQLGITPIREALKRLEQEGFVQSIPRFGHIVSPITIEDVRDIYELRLILEKTAIHLAVQRASDQQIAELREKAQFTYTYQDRKSYQEFLAHNTTFHTAAVLLSGNQRLTDSITRLLDEMARIFHIGLDLRDSANEMRAEHMALIEALEKRDADLAQQITHDQIITSEQRVIENLTGRTTIRSEINF
ncbi:MAG: GntR family transcriptional regulator [Anaerolineaceae bacterium]|nr:GntR family transcriptional regulator [Anaerolineaceae bacterium]